MAEENETQEQLETSLPTRKMGEKLEKPHLDGFEATIEDAQVINSGVEGLTKDKKAYVRCYLRLTYGGVPGTGAFTPYENYGGIYKFKNKDGTFGEVSFDPDGQNAVAKLFRNWLQSIGKTSKEVSIADFVHSLKGRKIQLKEEETMFQGNKAYKNVVGKFVG